MTHPNEATRRQAVEAIRLALTYLDHPEVARIPFAIPSRNIAAPARRALKFLAGGDVLPADACAFEVPAATDSNQQVATAGGYYLGHDVGGWYIARQCEMAREERGSVGFDGRRHFADESQAWAETARRARRRMAREG